MKFKFYLLIPILLLFVLNSCGYRSVYSSKGLEFSIGDISSSGDKNLTNYLSDKIRRVGSENNQIYDLYINIQSITNTISKDKQGNPSIFGLVITTKIDFIKEDKLFKSKTFSHNTTYSNIKNKFELKRYKKNLEKQLIDQIFDDFLLHVQNIK